MALRQRQAVLSGIFFVTIFTLISLAWRNGMGIVHILILGTIVGFFFGFTTYKMWIQSDEDAKRIAPPQLEADERVVFEAPANHYTWSKGFQGKLFLTNKRLIFIPNEIYRPKEEVAIYRTNIARSGKRSPIDYLNIKFIVTTSSGKKEKFTVPDRREWVAAFRAQSV